MGKKKIIYLVNSIGENRISTPKKIDYKEYRKQKTSNFHFIETREVKGNKTIIKALEIIE